MILKSLYAEKHKAELINNIGTLENYSVEIIKNLAYLEIQLEFLVFLTPSKNTSIHCVFQ